MTQSTILRNASLLSAVLVAAAASFAASAPVSAATTQICERASRVGTVECCQSMVSRDHISVRGITLSNCESKYLKRIVREQRRRYVIVIPVPPQPVPVPHSHNNSNDGSAGGDGNSNGRGNEGRGVRGNTR